MKKPKILAIIMIALIATISAVPFNTQAAQEDIVFSDGWENGDESAWNGSDGISYASDTSPKSGTYSLTCTMSTSANNGWAGDYREISGDGPHYLSAWVKFENPPNTDGEDQWALFFGSYSASNALIYAGITRVNGNLYWAVWAIESGTTLTKTVGNQFSNDNEYHYMELGIYRGDGNGCFELWVDGESEIHKYDIDNNARTLSYARVGFSYSDAPSTSTANLYIDDAVLSNQYFAGDAETGVPTWAHDDSEITQNLAYWVYYYGWDVNNIGTTENGKDIYEFTIGNGDTKICIDGTIHGHEWLSSELIYDITIWLMSERSDLLDNFTFSIIPTINRDSYGWYPVGQRTNANMVDLNRNFDVDWNSSGWTEIDNPDNYPGQFAESEAETQLISNWLETSSPSIYLNLHSGVETDQERIEHPADKYDVHYNKMQQLIEAYCEASSITPWNFVADQLYSTDGKDGKAEYYASNLGAYAFLIEVGKGNLTNPTEYTYDNTIKPRMKATIEGICASFNTDINFTIAGSSFNSSTGWDTIDLDLDEVATADGYATLQLNNTSIEYDFVEFFQGTNIDGNEYGTPFNQLTLEATAHYLEYKSCHELTGYTGDGYFEAYIDLWGTWESPVGTNSLQDFQIRIILKDSGSHDQTSDTVVSSIETNGIKSWYKEQYKIPTEIPLNILTYNAVDITCCFTALQEDFNIQLDNSGFISGISMGIQKENYIGYGNSSSITDFIYYSATT